MKCKIFGVIFLLIIGGCATSKYSTAEKHLKKKEYKDSIVSYLKLIEPHVRDGKRYIYYDKEAITGIGIVYWYMQRYQTAAKILQTVVNKDASFGKALFYLGLSWEGLGNEEEALQVYKKYPFIPVSDPYRYVLLGRMDWLVRKKISKEIQLAVQNEAQLNIANFPEKSVAVLYFLSLSDDPQWEPLQKGLAEMIITDLSKIEEIRVIERLRLNYLMDELKLSTSGLMDENSAPRLGKFLGARNLVKGSYMVMPDLKMTLDANIFETQKLYTPTTANLEGNLARLFRMEKEIVLRILDHFKIELTPQQRERILEIPTENMMAFMNYCRGLDAMDRTDFEQAQNFFQNAVHLDASFKLAQDMLVSPQIWEATHNNNFIRADYDVAQLIKRIPRERARIMYKPPDLVSTWNRLNCMGAYQNAGFIPGNDTRKTFQEAEDGSSLVPKLLPEPPLPSLK